MKDRRRDISNQNDKSKTQITGDDGGDEEQEDEPVSLFDIDLEELLGITYDQIVERSRNRRNSNTDKTVVSDTTGQFGDDEKPLFGKKEYNIFKKKFNEEDI